MRRSRRASAPVVLLLLGAVFLNIAPAYAAAGTVTEYPLTSRFAVPWGIAAGPDGAVWFAESQGNKIGRMTPNGQLTEYPLPVDPNLPSYQPENIVTGPDGNLWFTVNGQGGPGEIGRVTQAGVFTMYTPPTSYAGPYAITVGPDNAVWFTEDGNKIGRIDPATGALREFEIPTPRAIPNGIVAGPDGNIWFTEANAGKIGRLSLHGRGMITEFAVPSPGSGPSGIVAGPDGNLWFTEFNTGRIARMTTRGVFHEFPTPSGVAGGPFDIAAGPDGNLWFGENTPTSSPHIGRITTKGRVTEFALPSEVRLFIDGGPIGITAGPDGSVWFCDAGAAMVGKITVS